MGGKARQFNSLMARPEAACVVLHRHQSQAAQDFHIPQPTPPNGAKENFALLAEISALSLYQILRAPQNSPLKGILASDP